MTMSKRPAMALYDAFEWLKNKVDSAETVSERELKTAVKLMIATHEPTADKYIRLALDVGIMERLDNGRYKINWNTLYSLR